jgi:hypothetical protein
VANHQSALYTCCRVSEVETKYYADGENAFCMKKTFKKSGATVPGLRGAHLQPDAVPIREEGGEDRNNAQIKGQVAVATA